MRAVGVILGLVLVLPACTNGGEGTTAPRDLIYPNSQALREVDSSDAQLYEPPTGDNNCPTSFTEYGTHDPPEDVTKFFEARGFKRRGAGGRFDGGYRWIGVREGDESAWRKVDIANGQTAGRSEWETFYGIFAPACGTSG